MYKIKYEEYDVVYVGETERYLKARFSEYRRSSSMTSELSKQIHIDHPPTFHGAGKHRGTNHRAQMV